MDFPEALFVKQGKEEVKVYLFLFTCAITCVIHLEIVEDLAADTFLMAFHKLRSLPCIMVLDNDSTYLSAAEELRSLMESQTVKENLGRRHVS